MELMRSGFAGAPQGFLALVAGKAELGRASVVTRPSGGIVMCLFSDPSGGADRLRVLPSLQRPDLARDPARTGLGVAADLDLIARVFGLNVVQMAEVCGP